MFSVTIETVGNIDFRQYAPITSPHRLEAETFQVLRKLIRAYQLDEGIGGGNWTNPTLHHDGQPVGWMSYNCRVWEPDKSGPEAEEITIGRN